MTGVQRAYRFGPRSGDTLNSCSRVYSSLAAAASPSSQATLAAESVDG